MKTEWIDWHKTMRLFQAADVGLSPYELLAEWCGEGLIDSKAATISAFGTVKHDEPVDPQLWNACGRHKAGHIDGFNGSLKLAMRDPNDHAKTGMMRAFGLSFRKDQLLKLIPHVPREKVAEALAVEGDWLGMHKPKSVSAKATLEAPVPKSNAGRKPEGERWKSFYFAVVEIARDGRLTADHFPSANSLSEEVLDLMGDGAFSADHVKATISQIHKKFVAAG